MLKSSITVKDEVKCKASEDFYGIFFEDINRAGDGGIYPEMLRNRSFEDSIPPKDVEMFGKDNAVFVNKGGWPDVFNHGEGIPRWTKDLPYTPIPAWYVDGGEISLSDDVLNPHREAALKVSLGEGGRIFNVGYAGVPAEKDGEYVFCAFIKGEKGAKITASIQGEGGIYAADEITLSGEGYQKYTLPLISSHTDYDSKFVLSGDNVSFTLGFTSLMPTKTYKGHGLRTDLCEHLKGISPKFMRFPGGCIVEGLSKTTAMRFSDTIGPVWERPSKQLMWHYRATNGLGFHEYLQLCEDLGVEPLYVVNVGLTCQARVGELFEGAELEGMLKEVFDALEYAMGGTDTHFGKMRAEAGHPAPFKIKYIEIGNENFGEDYIVRYKKFYEALKAAYPDIIYIANTHTEWFGYQPEVVDEHFYDMPNFFAERADSFENYPRNGVKIFLGEYATIGGERVFNLNCALNESAWLLGAERNQDVVVLTSFAPLFQNVNFTSWAPNLIQFDNHRVCGIPTYHALKILGKYHGSEVLKTEVTTGSDCRKFSGLCGIECAYGLKFKDIKVNGESVGITKRMQNDAELCSGVYTAIPGGEGEVKMTNVDGEINALWGEKMREFQLERNKLPEAQSRRNVVSLGFGGEVKDGEYEISVFCEKDTAFSITLWNHLFVEPYGIEEPKLKGWSIRSVRNQQWEIEGDTGSVVQRPFFIAKDKNNFKKLPIRLGEYNTFKVVLKRETFDCYVNGEYVQTGILTRYNLVHATADRNGADVNLKIVNLSEQDEEITVDMGFDVEDTASGEILAGDPLGGNTLANPLNVHTEQITANTGRTFVYKAPKNSLTALKLKVK